MNILETPFLVELFFVISTVVFMLTLYAVLPSLVNKNKTVLTRAVWRRIYRSKSLVIEKTAKILKKKEIRIPYFISIKM